MQAAPVNDYSYSTLGKKYSLIAEAIYSKGFKKATLSAGGEFSISRTDNDYTGAVNTDALLNSNNLYLFTQLQGKLAWLNYTVGVGANRDAAPRQARLAQLHRRCGCKQGVDTPGRHRI